MECYEIRINDWNVVKIIPPPLDYKLIVWDGCNQFMGKFKEIGGNKMVFEILGGDYLVEPDDFQWRLLPKPPKDKTE